MSIEVDSPGWHGCDLPKFGVDAQATYPAELSWRCDECRARWRKRGGTHRWEQLSPPSWRWRRARTKELEAMLAERDLKLGTWKRS